MAACPYMPRPDETDEGQCQHRRAGTRPTVPETCAAGFELPGCPNGGATSGLPQDSRRNCCNAEVGTYVPKNETAHAVACGNGHTPALRQGTGAVNGM
jgi:hypothetical protein